jgi:RNA polymerase sigma-70 factor (ECF subfamily)
MINLQNTEHQDFADAAKVYGPDRPCTFDLSEKEAIDRAQHGDVFAFERIYKLHSPRVYALCLRMVGNVAEAQDLTQETFLMVMRKIDTFRGESAFSTWLHRIAVNLVLMCLRKKTSLESPLEETCEQDSDCPGSVQELSGIDLFLTGSLDRLLLERALGQLRPLPRVVVILHDIQGYKHTEIAKIMNCSIGNSKSRLHRARAQLRKLLKEGLGVNCLPPSRTTLPAFSA